MWSYLKKLSVYPAILQSLRLLLSMILANFIADLAHLREPYWALITAVIVTQSRIAQTLEVSRDQIVGSLIGGTAGIIAIALKVYLGCSSLFIFTIVMIPMAVLVSWRPTMRLGVVTLAIVFLFPAAGEIFERPFDRIFSIVVGVLASLVVSYCILRPQARYHAFLHACDVFDRLHRLLHAVLIERISWEEVEAQNDEIITELRELAQDIDEARKERPAYNLNEIDPILVQMFPILRRLQSDSIFVARAMDAYEKKLPNHTEAVLEKALQDIFTIFMELCKQQSNYKTSFHSPETVPDFDMILKPVLIEVKKSCPPVIQFTLKALCCDFMRGHDIFVL